MRLELGPRSYDLTTRSLVVGTLEGGPGPPGSSRHRDPGHHLDALFRRAEQHVVDGADALAIGGVGAGSDPAVTEAEELAGVAPVVEAVCRRFDLPVAVAAGRAAVAAGAAAAGASLVADGSGFADPGYLATVVAARVTVVITHNRPVEPADGAPSHPAGGVVPAVCDLLSGWATAALEAGIPPERIVVDGGLGLAKTCEQSLELLRGSDRVAALGHPVLLSAPGDDFGAVLGLGKGDERAATLAAVALGVTRGVRLVRVADVRGARRVCDVVAAILEAD